VAAAGIVVGKNTYNDAFASHLQVTLLILKRALNRPVSRSARNRPFARSAVRTKGFTEVRIVIKYRVKGDTNN